MSDVADLVAGVRSGNRAMLGRAITLVESTRAADAEPARELLAALLPFTGSAQRVGITGVPGVGKSTFIDALGTHLTGSGHRVAVLAVDPSSGRTGGSIMGDKTRMARLGNDAAAFIRPSPAGVTLGGVTRTTRETMVVVEAAGYDVVLVETVGVGQSETVVADMVDFFLVLMLPGAGDELQGIKKGVLELADMIAVNKADGDREPLARQAARDYQAALRLTHPASPNWTPPVMLCSALKEVGLAELWDRVGEHRAALSPSGEFDERRQDQQVRWMWSMLDDRLRTTLRTAPEVASLVTDLEAQVRAGQTLATTAADQILETLWQK